MKSKNDTKFKIELNKGTIYLTRGGMGAVLIERKLHFWILEKNYEDLGMALVYGWQGYQGYADAELIAEIQECFSDQNEIKELLRVQNKRLKIENAKWKTEWVELLTEIRKKDQKQI